MKYVERKGTECVKYSSAAIKSVCSNGKAQPFWVADMDFEIPEPALTEIKELANKGVYGYPAWQEPKKIVHDWLCLRHNYDVPEDQIAISPGVLTSIAIAMEQLPGSVIIPMPAYKPFVDITKNFNKKLVEWPFSYDKDNCTFSLDYENLEKLCKVEDNKILLFCSPQNPTSLVFSAEEIKKVATICEKHGVTVLCDEIHADLVYPEYKHVPFNQESAKVGATSIVFMAPSKTFNIAGEHFSITLFNSSEECKSFEKRLGQLHLGYSPLSGGILAFSCYKAGLPWLKDCLATLEDNANFIDTFFQEHIPEMKLIYPKATFITFIDCKQLMPLVEKDAQENPELYNPANSEMGSNLSRFFGQRAGVCMNAGTWFGANYKDFVRINFATSHKNLEEALLNMDMAVTKLREKY